MMSRLSSLLFALALAAPGAFAHDYTDGSVHIDHPWSRPTPPGTPMGVGYMALKNNGKESVILIGAQSPRAGHISIHESSMKDGIMRMQPVSGGLVIPPGKTVKLQPHSYHLMLENLNAPLKPGERIPVILQFDGAESISVELAVEPMDGGAQDGAMKMEHSSHGMAQ
ncbi:copper chaperone PCu(A)C [Marinobacter salinexigens]|uniref:Copper chaperone PCu(A)C n=1 Tax=Marinobacter salinexigens TaxID=2919747 RepID=A0A5B0VBW6_9GAMM|nr:copper chaperone PCu(A)C [Marinobacter salinexigens]KAA1171944.1 copper chaperone PCu(A)C [Marinobacter salinexigens]